MEGFEKAAKDLLEEFENSGRQAANDLLKQSEALGRSALTTTEIVARAARDLATGRLDLEGAEHVATNSFNQLKQLAMAEGNLVATSLVGWLEGIGKALFKLAPFLPLPL